MFDALSNASCRVSLRGPQAVLDRGVKALFIVFSEKAPMSLLRILAEEEPAVADDSDENLDHPNIKPEGNERYLVVERTEVLEIHGLEQSSAWAAVHFVLNQRTASKVRNTLWFMTPSTPYSL